MTSPLLERDFDELPASAAGRTPILRASEAENLAGVDTGRHTLSHTRLSVWLACHRKFELDYLKRYELVRRPRYFTLGAAYQKAIEYHDPEVGVRLLNGFEPCPSCQGRGHTGEGLLLSTCPGCGGRGYTGEQVHHYGEHEEREHRINEVIVRSAAKLYLKRWPARPSGTREFEYRVRLRSPWTGAYSNTYDLLGYADELLDPADPRLGATGVVADGLAGPLELVENKLVGRVERSQVLALPLDRQLALERYGIWRATGRPVTRVWYRWVKKPSIKQHEGRKKDKSDAETLDEFLERLAHDYECRPDFYALEEDPSFVTTKDLLRVEADLWEIAADMRSYMNQRPRDGRRRAFPRDTSRCHQYGGCHFIPICTGDPDAHSLYQVRAPRSHRSESAPEAE